MNKKAQIIIGFVIIAGISFYGGMKYDQSKTPTMTRGAGFTGGAGGQRGGRGAGGMGGGFVSANSVHGNEY